MTNETEKRQSSSSNDPFSFADELEVNVSGIIEVKVDVNPITNFGYLGAAMAKDIRRRNVDRYNVIDDQIAHDPIMTNVLGENATFECALVYYVQSCAKIRLECVTDKGCRNWRLAKSLLLSSTVQAAVAALGKFYDEDTGTMLIPVLSEQVNPEYDMSFLLRVSYYLRSISDLGIILHERAFPTSQYSQSEVMLCSMKRRNPSESERQVFSVSKLVHSNSAFIAYLLDLTSGDPGRYNVSYGFESRLKELVWRYL